MMPGWILRDSAAEPGGARLDLYERDGTFMIRADGWELMNGLWHGSEDELGRLAAALASGPAPRILVGGLGLGHTLAALLDSLRESGRLDSAHVVVAERSRAVLRWFAGFVNPEIAASLPPNVTLVADDVAAHLGGDAGWDAIVLDIDNGPTPLSAPANATLYDESGLAKCRLSLTTGGALLLWSASEDNGFIARALASGFSADAHFVPFPGPRCRAHVIYILKRRR